MANNNFQFCWVKSPCVLLLEVHGSPSLVGGSEHFLLFHILGIVIPTDSYFSRGVQTSNQFRVNLDASDALADASKASEDSETRTALLRVMTMTNERLLKSFSEAISAEAWRVREGPEAPGR